MTVRFNVFLEKFNTTGVNVIFFLLFPGYTNCHSPHDPHILPTNGGMSYTSSLAADISPTAQVCVTHYSSGQLRLFQHLMSLLWECLHRAMIYWCIFISIWVRSQSCGCLVTWFCYHLIAKPGNKTASHSWPDLYLLLFFSLCCRWQILTPSRVSRCPPAQRQLTPLPTTLRRSLPIGKSYFSDSFATLIG